VNHFPEIRIDIEGVRQTLVQSLYSSLENDKREIERQVTEQLKALDVAKLVEECVKQHAPRIIAETVSQGIRRAVDAALWTDEGRALMDKAVGGMAQRQLKKMARR
jgi:hypothetical protein